MEDSPLGWFDAATWAWNQSVAMIKAAWFHLHGSATFNDLEGFRRARPTKKYLTSSQFTTYALWWSGAGVFTPRLERLGCNLRWLVLPDPRNRDEIERLEDTWTNLRLDSVSRIWRSTQNALDLGVEVYWYWGWPGAALTFQNPDSDRGTLSIERISEHRGPGNRPIDFYRRKKNRDLFQREWNRFLTIKNESEPVLIDSLPDRARKLEGVGLSSPTIEVNLDTCYNTQTQGTDWLLRVFNRGPTRKFRATFQVPDGCPRNDRIALDPTQDYWWEKAEGTVSEIPTNAADYFRVSSQRTEHLTKSDDPHYPHSQLSLYRYDPNRDRPSHFCHMGYSPNIHDDPPEVIVRMTVAAVSSEPAVSREIRLRVDTGRVELLD